MEIGYVPEISWKEEKKNRIRYDMIWYSIDSASVYKYIDVIKLKLMLSFIHPMGVYKLTGFRLRVCRKWDKLKSDMVQFSNILSKSS